MLLTKNYENESEDVILSVNDVDSHIHRRYTGETLKAMLR